MRFKDLDAKVRGWRKVDLYLTGDGNIGVCLANTHFGIGSSVRQALDMALLEADRRKDHG